jgi:hypothetical protein
MKVQVHQAAQMKAQIHKVKRIPRKKNQFDHQFQLSLKAKMVKNKIRKDHKLFYLFQSVFV